MELEIDAGRPAHPVTEHGVWLTRQQARAADAVATHTSIRAPPSSSGTSRTFSGSASGKLNDAVTGEGGRSRPA